MTVYEFFWLFIIPATMFSWYHILRHMVDYIRPANGPLQGAQPRVIFSIAARKLVPGIQPTVDAIIKSCAEVGFTNYEVKLVVDKVQATVTGADVILVPPDFTCLSRYKARALHYALNHLPDSKDVWILHLDEDALVTPHCVKKVVSYIQNGGNPVANGPTVFPYDGNLITFYAEAQRQWTFYWTMDQVRSGVVQWLNGSNLLIRSDIEHKIGWSFVNCFISEDARFGYEATKKLGHVFGWHGGMTIEKPAADFKGLMKQRVRWFYGSLLNLRYVPKTRLPRRIYTLSTWLIGFVVTIFFFFIMVGLYQEPWFSGLFLLSGLSAFSFIWILRYQIGIYQNLMDIPMPKMKRALLHLGIIPMAPFIDLVCGLPSVLAFIQRPKAFEVTSKHAKLTSKSEDKPQDGAVRAISDPGDKS